jgi:hypothetical protein
MSSLVNLLEICFKQGQGAANQPDKLFPSLLQVSGQGTTLVSFVELIGCVLVSVCVIVCVIICLLL